MKIVACICAFLMGFCVAYLWIVPYDTSEINTENTTEETAETKILGTSNRTQKTATTLSEDDIATVTDYQTNRYAAVSSSYSGRVEGNNNTQFLFNDGENTYISYYVSTTTSTYTGTEDAIYLYYTYRYIGIRIAIAELGRYFQISCRQWTTEAGINKYLEITNTYEKLEVIATITSAESTTTKGDDNEEALVAFTTQDYDMEMTSSDGSDLGTVYEDERITNNIDETFTKIYDTGYLGFNIAISNVEEAPENETVLVYDNNNAGEITNIEYNSRVQETDNIITDENLIAGIYYAELWAQYTDEEKSNNFAITIFTETEGNYTIYTIAMNIGYSPSTYLASPNIMITNNGPIEIQSYANTTIMINGDVITLSEDEEVGEYAILYYDFTLKNITLLYTGTTTKLDVSEYLTGALTALNEINIYNIGIATAIEATVSILLVWALIKLFAHR